MKLIEITGDTKLIVYEKEHDYWSYDEEKKPYAIIEAETNGISDGLTFQAAYRIYRNKKGELFCNVRKQRVYLKDLGFNELNTCNEGKRGSEVPLATIEKCEELEKENHELQVALNKIYNLNPRYYGSDIFMKCQEIAKKALTRVNAVIGESE